METLSPAQQLLFATFENVVNGMSDCFRGWLNDMSIYHWIDRVYFLQFKMKKKSNETKPKYEKKIKRFVYKWTRTKAPILYGYSMEFRIQGQAYIVLHIFIYFVVHSCYC